MIYIGNYEKNNKESYKTIKRYSITSTCLDQKYDKFVPEEEFSAFWAKHKSQMTKAEAIIEYTRNYYESKLKNLDVYEEIEKLENSILLSSEKSNEFSHRIIIAEWIELQSIQAVNEVNLNFEGPATPLNNSYRLIVHEIIENLLKPDIEMGNFHSTKAASIYNRLSKIELEQNSEEYIMLVEPMYKMIEIIEKKYNQNKDHKKM